jgi:predicted Fe-Mo cluster-binding NifX family protein
VFETQKGTIIGSEDIPNPGHEPGFLPNFLHEKGVDVIISGGMGSRAVDIFNSHGIEAVVGASGDCPIAAEQYLKGELESTGAVCHEHDD